MAAKVDKSTCTGCAACAEACPVEAIKVEDNVAVVDADTCIDCGACAEACPTSSITVD